MKNVKCRPMYKVCRKSQEGRCICFCVQRPSLKAAMGNRGRQARTGRRAGRFVGRGGRKVLLHLPFCAFWTLFHVHVLPTLQFKNKMQKEMLLQGILGKYHCSSHCGQAVPAHPWMLRSTQCPSSTVARWCHTRGLDG